MYYTIYKTTNIINNKIYIGQHITDNLNDNYMGSGLNINRAIKKYGIENFKKEILFIFNSEDEMNAKEKELVTEQFISLNTNYNLVPGGFGTFHHINKNWKNIHKNRKHTVEILKERNDGSYEKYCKAISNGTKNKPKSEEHKKNLSKNKKIYLRQNPDYAELMINQLHDKTRNSIWITNGLQNKRISSSDLHLYQDWKRGRCKMKNKSMFWIHHNETNKKKMIHFDDYEYYKSQGYIKGVGKRTRSKKSH